MGITVDDRRFKLIKRNRIAEIGDEDITQLRKKRRIEVTNGNIRQCISFRQTKSQRPCITSTSRYHRHCQRQQETEKQQLKK